MKIGIITMHNIDNIGSVLQAYALQRKMELLGYDAKLIDYREVLESKKDTLLHRIILFFINAFLGFPKRKYLKRLRDFKNTHYKCTSQIYTRNNISEVGSLFDIFCTGSDQVWNPRFIGNDTSFMLDFVPDSKPRISYAASFAADNIPSEYIECYKSCLSKYKCITVREKTGESVVKSLIAKDCLTVCDPTLLLTSEEWNEIAEKSRINIKGKYILVYLLGYMFESRPFFYDIVNKVQKELGYKVYYINGWLTELRQPNSKVLFGIGPSEFITLIKNASFVITDSFHGSVFSTIYKTPLLGVVKNSTTGDGRIASLLRIVKNEESIIQYNSSFKFDAHDVSKYLPNDQSLKEFRDKSISSLTNMLN